MRRMLMIMLLALAPAVQAGDIAAARADFVRLCAQCHGPTGKGDGPQADALETRPRNLRDCAAMKTKTDDALFAVISEGGAAKALSPFMPPWKSVLAADEIHDMVAYIRSFCADSATN